MNYQIDKLGGGFSAPYFLITIMMDIEFSENYFELFGLPKSYVLDLPSLDKAFRELQTKVHPDRFAHSSDADRRYSMQWATLVNEAYQTLKKPVSRARYLLKLNDVDTEEETNTSMSPQFLMQQMELREATEEAKSSRDINALEALKSDLTFQFSTLEKSLHSTIDISHDFKTAADIVRKLRFLQKLEEEIMNAIEYIEDSE